MTETLIRATLTASEVGARIARLYPVHVLKIKQLEGYDDLNFYLEREQSCPESFMELASQEVVEIRVARLCPQGQTYKKARTVIQRTDIQESELIKNMCRSEDDGMTYKYICKVVNNIDSQKPDLVEAQNRLMEQIGKKGVSVPEPVPNNWLQYYTLETFGETKHLFRLLTYVNGHKLNDCPPSAELYNDVGDLTGRIYTVLKGYTDERLKQRTSPWLLASFPGLRKFLTSVEDPECRELARATVQDFEDKVVPVISRLEKGVMHGDINEHNVLVQDGSVSGLIDFGDACWGPVVFEIALCIAYMCLHSNNISTGKHVLNGYLKYRTLTNTERQIMKTCVCARLAQSLVLGCHSALENPGNTYILSSQKNGWPLLRQLTQLDDTHLRDLWGLEGI